MYNKVLITQIIAFKTTGTVPEASDSAKRRFTPILTTHPMQIVQADLVDMSSMAGTNSGYCWILNIVDLFSKYLWSYPLKRKTEEEVSRAVASWIEDLVRPCEIFHTDNGKEFVNKELTKVPKDNGITHRLGATYTPSNQVQVERTNGTLKRILFSYMTQSGSTNWVNALPICVRNYNTTLHTTIKTIPIDVLNGTRSEHRAASRGIKAAAKNTLANNNRLYGQKILVGDKVRISLIAFDSEVRKAKLTGIGALAKGYRTQYLPVHTVVKVSRLSYQVADLEGEVNENLFKKADLRKVSAVESRQIAPIVRVKKVQVRLCDWMLQQSWM